MNSPISENGIGQNMGCFKERIRNGNYYLEVCIDMKN
jgi:hypothetical protein